MLVAGGVVSALAWIVINRRLNLIDPKHLPSFGILRQKPVGLLLIAHESLSMLNPLTGSYAPFRTNATGTSIGSSNTLDLQAITATLVEYLVIAGGLSGIFAKRKNWAHWTGLLSLVLLYLGGMVLGIGLWRTYDVDPSLSGRYGLSVAPLLALALASTLRGRWIVGGLWVFSTAVCGLTWMYLLAA
jgi:hypothetical protein